MTVYHASTYRVRASTPARNRDEIGAATEVLTISMPRVDGAMATEVLTMPIPRVVVAEGTAEGAQDHVAKLFGRDSLYMLLWGVQLVVAAGSTPLITRAMGLGEFGTVTSANAAMQILFVFAGIGLQSAVEREYSARGNKQGARRLISLAGLISVAVCFLAWMTVDLWAGSIEMSDRIGELRLAVLWGGSSALTTVVLAMLRCEDRLGAFGTVSALQSVFAAGLGLVLVEVIEPTAQWFLIGQVVAQFLAMTIGLIMAPPAVFGRGDYELLNRALRFSLPLVPTALSSFVLSTSNRLIVETFMGSEQVARYQIAYNVASMPMLLLSILNTAWMPRFFGIVDEAERRSVLAASRDALYRLLVPIVVGFAVGAPLVLKVWAPPSYHPEQLHLVVSIVLVTAIPYAGQLAVTRALMADGSTKAAAGVTFAAAIVNLILNLIMVPKLGLIGSALATLAAYSYLYVILALVGRKLRIPPSPRVLQVELAAAVGLALLSSAVPETPLTLTLRVVAGIGTVAWFLRRFVAIQNTPDPTPVS
ncbi:lipopolysaccharide biosynthesis protein [Micromonosporaceae bacterium Da 78-11]